MTAQEPSSRPTDDVMRGLAGLRVLKAARSHSSMFLLHLGEWREKFDAKGRRRQYGSWVIMVEMSPWEISRGHEAVYSSEDEYDRIEVGLAALLDDRIASASLDPKRLGSLQIAFQSGSKLNLFHEDPVLLGPQWTILREKVAVLYATVAAELGSDVADSGRPSDMM